MPVSATPDHVASHGLAHASAHGTGHVAVAPGGGWAPDDVAGLTLWIDYDNAGSITLDGSNIVAIDSLDPVVKTFAPIEGYPAPVQLVASINGHDVASYTTTAPSVLGTTGVEALNGADGSYTLAATVYPTGDGGGAFFMMLGAGGLVLVVGLDGDFAPDPDTLTAFTFGGAVSVAMIEDAWHAVVATYNGATDLLTLRVDGVEVGSGLITHQAQGDFQLFLGAAEFPSGIVRHLDTIAYDSVLSGADLTNLETYLMGRVT